MLLARSIHELRAARSYLGNVALVPTMGALHAGHVSLIETARMNADKVIVTIFVNPTQFGPREDFNRYPRPLEMDLKMCREAGVDAVFAPSVEEMYPALKFPPVPEQVEGSQATSAGASTAAPAHAQGTAPDAAHAGDEHAIDFTLFPIEPVVMPQPPGAPPLPSPESIPVDIGIDIPSLMAPLEGKHRPGHFKGVCQVVAKLFNITQPNVACFGQKDYQQFRILQAMTDALNWPIRLVCCPTLREQSGLAMSSRNQYLSARDHDRATCISRALFKAEADVKAGILQTNRLIATIQRILLEQHLQVDYIAAVDPITLKTAMVVGGPTVLAIAARVGTTRLIDNIIVEPPPVPA
jgi:pantoate ligase/cytidylate kinase